MSDRNSDKGWVIVLLALIAALIAIMFMTMMWAGRTNLSLAEVLASLTAALGLSDAPEGIARDIVELRMWRALTTAGVGAALAYSGALLQGVFRNGLAAPSIIGVTAGASLGASTAILFLTGVLPFAPFAAGLNLSSFVILLSSFAGSFLAVLLVVLLASERGRVSIPSLLLTGIAVNACLAGLLSAVQAYALRHDEVSRAIYSWTFGNLDDKAGIHALLVWSTVLFGILIIPKLANELDLFAGGEDDARALGVPTSRTKIMAISAAALLAACGTAVAGQIAFVGLVVPHLVRLLAGSTHVRVLPLSVVGGAVFLSGAECAQVTLLGEAAFRPGVLMSLVGGPFFLFLLWRRKGSLQTW